MKINIDLTKALANIAGKSEFELDFPEKRSISLNDVFSELIKQNPKMEDIIYENDGSYNYHIIIFINDKPLQSYEEKTLKLKDGDEVHMFPIVGGG